MHGFAASCLRLVDTDTHVWLVTDCFGWEMDKGISYVTFRHDRVNQV